jgi:hypothetical protein
VSHSKQLENDESLQARRSLKPACLLFAGTTCSCGAATG